MQKQVVLNEEQPSLQEIRGQRRNHRINYFLMCFTFGLMVFLLSPWSQITDVLITGNHYYERKELLETIGLPRESNFLLVMSRLAEIKKLPLVKDVRVSWEFPQKLYLSIVEEPIYGYGIFENGFYLFTKEKMHLVESSKKQKRWGKLPFLNLENKQVAQKVASLLGEMKGELLMSISEIKMFERGHHPEMVEVLMNDGNRLFVKIERLVAIKKYPSIFAKLEGESRCIYFNELTDTAVASECSADGGD